MPVPVEVKDALDQLAAEVRRLGFIVDGSHPDFFLFDEWQQDPPQLPPAQYLAPPFIPESSSTQDLTEPYDDWQQLPEAPPPPWFYEKPEVIRSQATADVTTI